MPYAEIVVFAFAAFREACQPAKLANGVHPVFAPRQDFVRITLVPHVPNQVVLRCFKHIMQRNRQFHHAQIAGKVPACFAHAFQ